LAEVDISRYHFRRTHGMFLALGTWCRHGIGEWRRCLVIMRAASYGTDDMRIFVVHDDVDLPNWALDLKGMGDVALALQLGRRACQELDIEDTTTNAVAIITIVNENMYELIMMPPPPERETAALADVIVTERESGRRIEKELRADV